MAGCAERMFGWTREEVLGQDIGILMADSVAKAHRVYMERYLTVCPALTPLGCTPSGLG